MSNPTAHSLINADITAREPTRYYDHEEKKWKLLADWKRDSHAETHYEDMETE